MSFLLKCPNHQCGKRPVADFSFGGEVTQRPQPESEWKDWVDYVYLKDNKKGDQVEWWYCRSGCRRWFVTQRDTLNNLDHQSWWYDDWKRESQSS